MNTQRRTQSSRRKHDKAEKSTFRKIIKDRDQRIYIDCHPDLARLIYSQIRFYFPRGYPERGYN